jgi:MATE family multidrug resistance protein
MKVTDSAVLGHVGTNYLDATALSDLWTSSTGVFIQSRVVGTFCGQAFGAGNKMLVGIWIQVAYSVLFAVMVPVAICWFFTKPFLLVTGNTEEESSDAGYFAMVLALCLPIRIAFSQLTTFFSAQKIVRPGAVCATSAMSLNLVGTLVFVLGLGIPNWKGFGFVACPIVTTVVEYVQFFILWFVFVYWKKLHIDCWPGWSRKHITRDRVKQFIKMYWPAALSIGSDFWRVAAIGAIAKTMSPDSLGVFNVSYRICWICLTFVGSLTSAVGIQLNLALGRGSSAAAKRQVSIGLSVCALVLGVIGVIIVLIPRLLGRLFSDDEVILDLFESSRWTLMIYVVLMNFAVCLELIPSAAGRTKSIFYAGLIGSWGGQVPGVILCTRFWRNDLVGLFAGVSIGYGILCVLYGGIVASIDWDVVAAEARARSEVGNVPAPETTVSMQQSAEKSEDKEEDSVR